MRSTKKAKSTPIVSSAPSARVPTHIAFMPLVLLTFVVWVIYRTLFRYPVWFDESIGKAIFFGLPVWLYITVTRSKSMIGTFSPSKIRSGLLLGIAVGGILGFVATIATLVNRQVIIQAAPLFSSDMFWWEFFLAILTGFWESLFFYTWMMTVISEKYRHWGLFWQLALTAGLFVAFHVPNMILRSPNISLIATQVFLLFFFAYGQALLYARWKNVYALTMSHAIWGMVLLVHTR